MKPSIVARGIVLSAASVLLAFASNAPSQTPAAPAALPAKSNPAGPLEAHVAANLRLLTVMESYAEALASARDTASAEATAIKIEAITREAGIVGAEVLKLGKPSLELQQAISRHPEIVQTGRRVTARTKAAAQALSSNPGVAGLLKPSMGNFQQAMRQLQQAADTGAPAAPVENAPATPATPANGTPPAKK